MVVVRKEGHFSRPRAATPKVTDIIVTYLRFTKAHHNNRNIFTAFKEFWNSTSNSLSDGSF